MFFLSKSLDLVREGTRMGVHEVLLDVLVLFLFKMVGYGRSIGILKNSGVERKVAISLIFHEYSVQL